jgi:putative peptidoglycan lipid II flippase
VVGLAAVFGVGSVIDAHAFASVIPAFFLVVVAGQSGPLQSALVSVLSREPQVPGPLQGLHTRR